MFGPDSTLAPASVGGDRLADPIQVAHPDLDHVVGLEAAAIAAVVDPGKRDLAGLHIVPLHAQPLERGRQAVHHLVVPGACRRCRRGDGLDAGPEARLVRPRIGAAARHHLQQHLVSRDSARIGRCLGAGGKRETDQGGQAEQTHDNLLFAGFSSPP